MVFQINKDSLIPTGLGNRHSNKWILVFLLSTKNGDPALSRRGDFSVSNTGLLVDGAGAKILDIGGAP